MSSAKINSIVAGTGWFMVTAFGGAAALRLTSWSQSHEKQLNAILVFTSIAMLTCFIVWIKAKDAIRESEDAEGATMVKGNVIDSNVAIYNYGSQVVDKRQFGVAKAPPNIVALMTNSYSDTSTAQFQVDAPFINPMFLIKCERPCSGISISFLQGTNWVSVGTAFSATSDARVLLATSGNRTFLGPGMRVQVTVRPRDKQPVTIVAVEAYAV